MLCSRCYKKIPKGEEVQQSSSMVWRSGWVEGGYGSIIVCRKCSIKIRRQNRKFFIVFISLFIIIFAIAFGSVIISILNKNN